MDGKFTDSVASPSDSLERVHAHSINTRPSFPPRGAGSVIKVSKCSYVFNNWYPKIYNTSSYSISLSPDTCAPDWVSTRDSLIISSSIFSLLTLLIVGVAGIIFCTNYSRGESVFYTLHEQVLYSLEIYSSSRFC